MNHPYNPPIVRQVERRESLVPERAPGARRTSIRGGERPDGTGQSIGLVQFDTFVTSDVVDYFLLIGAPPEQIDKLSRVSVNGGVATPGAGESEVLLDIDVAMNMAPGANVVVYSAP